MNINSVEEYGVRCLMQVAAAAHDKPVTVARVGEGEGLSDDYAGKLLHQLRGANLVRSVQGRGGGFVLARPAYTISLAEILRVFSTGIFGEEFCQCYTGKQQQCVHLKACSLRPVWWGISQLVNQTLERISLMDLMKTEFEMLEQVENSLATIRGSGTPKFDRLETGLNAADPSRG